MEGRPSRWWYALLGYTIMVHPLIFMVVPRLGTVCRARGYVTPADFVRGRYGSRPLATVIALAGLLAKMPYIALQLVGMQIVLGALGVEGDWPLIIAFAILAAYYDELAEDAVYPQPGADATAPAPTA